MKAALFLLALCLAFAAPLTAGAPEARATETSDADGRLALEEWVFQAALAHANPKFLPQFPGHEETLEQVHARYRAIASDIVAVTGNRKGSAALLLAFAIGESGLGHDADIGPCFQEIDPKTGRNWKGRCDGGRAAGIWQMHQVYDTKTGETITVEQLFADRQRAATIFHRLAAASIVRCQKQGFEPIDQLSAVGLGECKAGDPRVRARWHLWQKLRAFKPAK